MRHRKRVKDSKNDAGGGRRSIEKEKGWRKWEKTGA